MRDHAPRSRSRSRQGAEPPAPWARWDEPPTTPLPRRRPNPTLFTLAALGVVIAVSLGVAAAQEDAGDIRRLAGDRQACTAAVAVADWSGGCAG